MKGDPQNMQDKPDYQDLLLEVREFLKDRILTCKNNGISPDRLIIDIGFDSVKLLSKFKFNQ